MAASSSFIKSTSLLFLLLVAIQFILIDAHGGTDDDESHDGTGAENLHSKKLIMVKVWCLIIFFFSTFIFGVSPYFFKWNESFLLLGTQFAGGVFLGTALMHFLSDSTSTFEAITSIDYPFSYMLACAGYLLTMFGDCAISFVAKRSVVASKVAVARPAEESGRAMEEVEGGMEHNPIFIRTTSVGDTILLIFALCFHSVFEGIAVGVASNEADAWKNLWTISLHKVFAAIAMGIALLRMIPKRPFLATVAYSFAFAISSPVGVGIGIAIDATVEGRRADWTFAISMGLACGIFIYVAINHLIANGYQPQKPCYFDTRGYRFVAVLLGIAIIAVVMTWD